jgi:hypothetical protein
VIELGLSLPDAFQFFVGHFSPGQAKNDQQRIEKYHAAAG